MSLENAHEFSSPVLQPHGIVSGYRAKSEIKNPGWNSSGFYVFEPSVFDYDDSAQDYLVIDEDIRVRKGDLIAIISSSSGGTSPIGASPVLGGSYTFEFKC